MLISSEPTLNELLFKAALLEHLPAAIFVFVLGACVGSFLNVVNFRLPRNMRLLVPPSNCPSCNHRLRFFRENLPIIGWLAIRGKCKYCKSRVSLEYPLIELITAMLFLATYAMCYWIPVSTPFLGEIFGSWWHVNGLFKTFPMFLAVVTMIAGLLSMTVIDSRTYIIPIQIPLCMTLIAFLANLVQPMFMLRHTPSEVWPYPLIDWSWAGVAFGGFVGVLITCFLLRLGVLKYSFADYDDFVEEGETLGLYPHARREVCKEFLSLLPIILGALIGFLCFYEKGIPALGVQAIAGSMLGYLVGGGLVWCIRIVGTLGFGKEAMGLGDVHLLAGVGAVIGWWDPILIFFIAPFSGLLWAASSTVLEKMGRKQSEIPYGPHLAVATLIVIFARPAVDWVWAIVMPGVSMPASQKLQVNDVLDDFTFEVSSAFLLVESTQNAPKLKNKVFELTNEQKKVSIPITPLPVGCGKEKQDVFFELWC